MEKRITVSIRVTMEKKKSWYSYEEVATDEFEIAIPVQATGAIDFTKIVENLTSQVIEEGENKLLAEPAEEESEE